MTQSECGAKTFNAECSNTHEDEPEKKESIAERPKGNGRGQGRKRKEIHRNVFCDGCHASPLRMAKARANNTIAIGRRGCIKGPRFKSKSVFDFDLCASCIDGGGFEDSHGPFQRISTRPHATENNLDAPRPPDSNTAVHKTVVCDYCEDDETGEARKHAIEAGTRCRRTGHIKGVRYKSAVHEDFDLCATCEAKVGIDHQYAPFLKIAKSSQNQALSFASFQGSIHHRIEDSSVPNLTPTGEKAQSESFGNLCAPREEGTHLTAVDSEVDVITQSTEVHPGIFSCDQTKAASNPQPPSQAGSSKQAHDFSSALHDYICSAFELAATHHSLKTSRTLSLQKRSKPVYTQRLPKRSMLHAKQRVKERGKSSNLTRSLYPLHRLPSILVREQEIHAQRASLLPT